MLHQRGIRRNGGKEGKRGKAEARNREGRKEKGKKEIRREGESDCRS
jgi:hypothetical protein